MAKTLKIGDWAIQFTPNKSGMYIRSKYHSDSIYLENIGKYLRIEGMTMNQDPYKLPKLLKPGRGGWVINPFEAR